MHTEEKERRVHSRGIKNWCSILVRRLGYVAVNPNLVMLLTDNSQKISKVIQTSKPNLITCPSIFCVRPLQLTTQLH